MNLVCSHRTCMSIWYNVCACHSPVYHYIAATNTIVYLLQRIIAACVVVIWFYENIFYKKLKNVSCEYDLIAYRPARAQQLMPLEAHRINQR